MPRKSREAQPTPAKPRPVGRPRSIPTGAKVRAVRLTDAEWAAVLALVERMRKSRTSRSA